MAVASEVNRNEYVGNGSTVVAYPITFRFDDSAWLSVFIVNALGVVSDYATWQVTGSNLFTTTAIPNTSKVVITRKAPSLQSLVLPHSPDLERALDRIVLMLQDRARGLSVPASEDPAINVIHAPAAARKGKLGYFDPTTGGVTEISISDLTALILAALGPVGTIINPGALALALATHVANVSNPHAVTKTQVGLGNVDNTSDLNKPVSNATYTVLNQKADSSSLGDASTKTVGTGSNQLPYAQHVVKVADKATAADILAGTANKWLDALEAKAAFKRMRTFVLATDQSTASPHTNATAIPTLVATLSAGKSYRVRAVLIVQTGNTNVGAWLATTFTGSGGGHVSVWEIPGSSIAGSIFAGLSGNEYQPATSPVAIEYLVVLEGNYRNITTAGVFGLTYRSESTTVSQITIRGNSYLEVEELA